MNYTKAPWWAEMISHGNWLITTPLNDDSKVIAQVQASDKIPMDDAIGNMRLTKSAPDMYEALKRVAKWGKDRNFSSDCESGKMLIEVEQALSKAEGK